MRKFILLVPLLCLACASQLAAQTHDLEILSISPASGSRTPLNIAAPVMVEARNRGAAAEQNVKIVVTARDTAGPMAYADSTTIGSWSAGEIKDIALKDFTPDVRTRYLVTASIYVATDQVHSNDTLTTRWTVGYEYDVAARVAASPAPFAQLPQKVNFSLVGRFINQSGIADDYDVPVRIRIRSLSPAALVFQSDTIARELYIDSPAVSVRFASRSGNYDVRKLVPGEYELAVVARYPTDGDRTNDTAYSEITILPNRLAHDVGVDSILAPLHNEVLKEGAAIAPTAHCTNVGEANESAVVLRAILYDRNQHIVYRDSATLALSAAQSTLHVFQSVTPSEVGKYTLAVSATIASDGYEYNDTMRTTFFYGEKYAYRVVGIASPAPDTTLFVEDPLHIAATIEWHGSIGTTPGSIVYAELYRASTNALLLRNRTSVGPLGLDSPRVTCHIIDSLSARYDTGAMRLAVVVPYYDTLWRDFTITRGRHLAVDTILSPQPILASATCPIHLTLHNDGIRRFDSVKVWVDITRPQTNGYAESQLFHDVEPGDSLDLVLKDFTAPTEGIYKLTVYWFDLEYRDDGYPLIDSPFEYQRADVAEYSDDRAAWFDGTRSILHAPGGVSTIRIIDLLGRDVTNYSKRTDGTQFDLRTLPHGIYLIHLATTNHEEIVRILR